MKENILSSYIWYILLTPCITQKIYIFDGLAWKHAFAQIVFPAITIHLNKKYILFCDGAWKHYLLHIISQTMSPQIFLFDSHTWKHDSRETVVTAIIKCISKMYFLIPGPAWKCFVVYNISHKHTANILFDSQAWKHYSLKIIGYNNINLMYKYYTLEWKYFCFMLGLNTFCNFYYQANKFDVQA